jgi:tRNA(fMet)-specific endonuclease VapC
VIVADTDVLVDYLRGAERSAGRVALELRHGLATTAVSAFELWAGSLGSARREKVVDDLLGSMRILAVDAVAARRAAEVRRALEGRGLCIPMADSLIAGACLAADAILLTRDRGHFERVEGLRLGEI